MANGPNDDCKAVVAGSAHHHTNVGAYTGAMDQTSLEKAAWLG